MAQCVWLSTRRTVSGWRQSWLTATGLASTLSGRVSCWPRPIAGRRKRWRTIFGVSRPTVWRWQQHFVEAGVDGLLRDRTRKPGKAPIARETAARLEALTCTEPPHQATHWLRSGDPGFAAKLTDIVGLYVGPPAHAVVLSLDEKSQIQALDRTQPRLPIKPGHCQTMTHDKHHGTTTLFAALSRA
jgi:hypothetical protein